MSVGHIDTDGVIVDLLLNGGYVKAEIASLIGSSVETINAALIVREQKTLFRQEQEAKLISLYKRCNKCGKKSGNITE